MHNRIAYTSKNFNTLEGPITFKKVQALKMNAEIEVSNQQFHSILQINNLSPKLPVEHNNHKVNISIFPIMLTT